MNQRQLVLLLCALVPGVACLDDDDDDATDIVQPPDDDDAGVLFSGTVRDWGSEAPAQGVSVGLGDLRDTTGAAGGYRIRSPFDAPQQVDFYDSPTDVTSYADCDRVHDHWTYPTAQSRGWGALEVRVWLDGYTGQGALSGTWVREGLGGSLYVSDVDELMPDESDGDWSISLPTDAAERWWLSLSEVDEVLVGWGVASGDAIEEDGGEIALSLGVEDLVAGTWNDEAEDAVAAIRVRQTVAMADGWLALRIGLRSGAPTGALMDLTLVDRAPLSFELSIQRDDLPDCGYQDQGYEVPLDSPEELLELPPLFDVPRLLDARGGIEWGFRPEVTWSGLPDDPESTNYLALYAYPDGGEASLSWVIHPGATCGPDTARWPGDLPSIPPESWGWAIASTYGPARWATCGNSFTWPGL